MMRTDGYLDFTDLPKTKYLIKVDGFKVKTVDLQMSKRTYKLVSKELIKIGTTEEIDTLLAQLD